MNMTRTFDDRPAVREKTPLLIGLVSPSGAGKTMSALELATGIQRVSPGDIFVIDSEARRSLHYADKYKFRHVPFGAPFAPADYKAAIQYCIGKGAGTIVVDSQSHEHEGPGGVLEWHEKELDRMAGADFKKRNKMTMAAWAKPKAARRDLINFILQQPVNFIFCFRAKSKIKMKRGEDPIEMGFQAISGDEWIFEMQLNCLLLPGAKGIPIWQSDMPGEQACIKLPEQFRQLFSSNPRLSADIGEALAMWAAGTEAPKPRSADELCADYARCGDPATLGRLESQRALAWAKLSKDDKVRVKQASDDARERIERAERTFDDTPVGAVDDSADDESDADAA
jgi:hypothetical protein